MNSKLNRDWIIFFHSPSCGKNIYKILTKNTGGYDVVRKIDKKLQHGKTN